MAMTDYASFGFGTDTSDESIDPTDNMGPATVVNQETGISNTAAGNPARALVMVWMLALISYWGLGYFFRKVNR
jgi:hypothetical protein